MSSSSVWIRVPLATAALMIGWIVVCCTLASMRSTTCPPRWIRPRIGGLSFSSVPPWMEVAASVVLLDLAIYGQHVAFHAVPVLWRLHRMHHADLEFDVTTGVRFHPVEIILSMVIKLAVVTALGAP